MKSRNLKSYTIISKFPLKIRPQSIKNIMELLTSNIEIKINQKRTVKCFYNLENQLNSFKIKWLSFYCDFN